jgi:hypothetical protein
VINDDRLTLGDGGKMKLNMDLFPVGMVELMDKKVLVHTDRAETTKGKNVVVFDELRNWMIKPHNTEIGVWKNVQWKLAKRVKPTSAMLIEKYQRQLEEYQRYWVTRGIKRDIFFEAQNRSDQPEPRRTEESRRRLVQQSMDQVPGVRQNARVTDQSGLGNLNHCNRPDMLRKEEEPSQEQEQVKKHVMMVGSWPCTVSSEVQINGRCVSELARKDNSKATILESEDEKDPKRARMVLSKGLEVVGPGYSRLSGDAARVTDRVEESGNPNRVNRVRREYDMDQRTDQVTQDSRGNRDGYSGRRADRVTRDSPGNQDYDSSRQTDWVTRDSRGNRGGGSGQHVDRVTRVSRGNRDSNPKSGNSSRVTENSANVESRVMENSATMKSRVMENLANTKSQVTENSANTESRVTKKFG